jgi:hypothetical protein
MVALSKSGKLNLHVAGASRKRTHITNMSFFGPLQRKGIKISLFEIDGPQNDIFLSKPLYESRHCTFHVFKLHTDISLK